MVRIVVKWCQELKAAYDSTRQRSEPFRMKDGREEFIDISYHHPLHKCLQEEKDKANDKLKEIMANNFEQQSLLSKDDNLKDIDYFSEFEGKTGFFNAHLSRNSEYYLIFYLNALIHGLLKSAEKLKEELGN